MKIRTLLVDSPFLLKRSYHGAKDVYTTKFGYFGGVYGFFMKLRKLVDEYKINKVVLAWDGENGGIHRHQIDRAYKANRKSKSWHEKIQLSEVEIKREEEKKESVLKQKKRIQAYAEELFLRQIEVDEIEADDIIASYCMRYNNKEEIYIFTNDRDFAQLLDLNISIIFANIEQPITKDNFFFKFNYHYSNALAMKVITGDVSDNIAGIKGLKETTLIKHFPDLQFKNVSVREICQMAREINDEREKTKKKPLKIFENLLSSINILKRNHKIINLHEPFLNDEAVEELQQLEMPLSPEGRSSKNLYNYMMEDEFLTVYKGTFVNFIQPFYSVIANEKDLLKEFEKINK